MPVSVSHHPMRYVPLSPSYGEDWGTKKLSGLPKIAQSLSCKAACHPKQFDARDSVVYDSHS